MKNIFLTIGLTAFTVLSYGQYTFVAPESTPGLDCHANVNERVDQNFRNDLKRAAFRLTIPEIGNCTGTLINRNTGQNNLGQYFITAWHCFKSGTDCGGNEFNFNSPVTLTFNYQSPNNQTLVFSENNNGSQYRISRRVRLVDKFVCAYGDFALCEILDNPIPPHFNPYYAGWYPNELFINRNGNFGVIHHPGASIKKVTETPDLIGNRVVKQSCRTTTKVIDFLFGWIWGRKWSTQVVCTYIQSPLIGTKYRDAGFSFGTLEEGSSGAGLFTGNNGFAGANRFIGDYSASFPNHHCDVVFDIGKAYFGKFADSYYRQSVKNTLNPPDKYGIDQGGIPGRQITCYPVLNINAEGPGGFNLYPANLYQQDNRITLTSQSTTNTNGEIRVRQGADFVFQAGQSINLNPGFEVQLGADFNTSITSSPCFINNNSYRAIESEESKSEYETPDMNKLLENIPLPKEKKFDITKYSAKRDITNVESINTFNLYPNPSNGNINLQLFFKEQEKSVAITIYDLTGRIVYTKQFRNCYFIKEQLQTNKLSSGMYYISVKTSSGNESKKFVVTK